MINVGVDVNDFTPVNEELLTETIKQIHLEL
jgi:calcineurin-like phosphoesterase family protein